MNLSDRALLVQLSISQWTARKYDKRVTQQALTMNYASSDAGRFNKSLLPANDYLDMVHAKSAAIRHVSFLANNQESRPEVTSTVGSLLS